MPMRISQVSLQASGSASLDSDSFTAVQHQLVAVVRASLQALATEIQEVLGVVLSGENMEGSNDVLDFQIEGDAAELCLMVRDGECFDEVITVCYDLPDPLRQSLAQFGLDEVVLAGYTFIQWFANSIWGHAALLHSERRPATIRVKGDARVWDLVADDWQVTLA